MAEVLGLGEQPNFDAMSQQLAGLSVEIGRFPNLIATQNTNTILAAIRDLGMTLRNEIRTSANTLRAELRADIRTSADTLRAELRADIRASADALRAELRAELRADIRTSADNLRSELRADIRTSAETLRADTQEMGRSLKQSLEDLDHNSRARVLNSVRPLPTLRIHPLKNTTTHEVVPLPETIADLDALSSPELVFYLEALGQTPERTIAAKRVQLKECIGIRAS